MDRLIVLSSQSRPPGIQFACIPNQPARRVGRSAGATRPSAVGSRQSSFSPTMRELMENPARAAEARHWHMRPVAIIWIDLIRRGQHAGALGKFDAEMFVFSFTGAIAHFHSAPTAAAAFLSIAGSAEVVGRYRSWPGDSTLAMLRGYSH